MTFEANLSDALKELYHAVNAIWRLGRNMVVGWSHVGSTVYLCVVPTYKAFEIGEEISHTFSKSRLLDEEAFLDLCKGFGARPTRIELQVPIGNGPNAIAPATIDRVLRRYSVTQTPYRGVMLFDIVGFSKASPIEQVAQLNSLEYSINSADKRLQSLGLDVELARSTVGDGFYVWNRRQGIEADLRTYLALMLIMIDNRRAHMKGDARFVPTLRAVFGIGSHYSYYQVEGQTPRGFEYIVGDVTINTARLIGKCESHQILMGNFRRPVDRVSKTLLDGPLFLARAASEFGTLDGLEFGGEPVTAVRSYITGTDLSAGNYSVTQYAITDKHGFQHNALNLIIQVTFEGGESLSIGLDSEALGDFDAEATPYRLNVRDLAKVKDLFRA
ncbi:MAG: hypothetical protein HQ481_21305 [Alphaproteobacteria bacterium]|nr:hypothetical protein [Alphaproteobacteria bacterium]